MICTVSPISRLTLGFGLGRGLVVPAGPFQVPCCHRAAAYNGCQHELRGDSGAGMGRKSLLPRLPLPT